MRRPDRRASTVQPKDGAPGYEIIAGDGVARAAQPTGRNGSRGATGQRVWNVLTF